MFSTLRGLYLCLSRTLWSRNSYSILIICWETEFRVCIPHLLKLLQQSQTIFLKGCKGNKQISKLLISNIGILSLQFPNSSNHKAVKASSVVNRNAHGKGLFVVSQSMQSPNPQTKKLFTPPSLRHKYSPTRPNFEADGQDMILALLVPGNKRCHMVLQHTNF